MNLVERDFLILREIDRWRFCLGRHIQSLASFSGARACDRRLKALIEAGYIDRKKILYGIPSVYFLTHKGKTLIEVNKRPDKFRTDRIYHDIAVIDSAIYLNREKEIDFDNITTEKQMHSKEGFNTRKHFPDFVFEKDGLNYCVEIELTAKSKQRFEKNVEENYLTYEKQIWIVPNSAHKIKDSLKEFETTYSNIEILDLEEVQKKDEHSE